MPRGCCGAAVGTTSGAARAVPSATGALQAPGSTPAGFGWCVLVLCLSSAARTVLIGTMSPKARNVVKFTRRLYARWNDYCTGQITFAEFDASAQGWTNPVRHAKGAGAPRLACSDRPHSVQKNLTEKGDAPPETPRRRPVPPDGSRGDDTQYAKRLHRCPTIRPATPSSRRYHRPQSRLA